MKNHLLLVEDDENLGISLRRLLLDETFSVQLAADLKAARKSVEESKFDLLIVDWRLPDGQGIDLVKEMRASGSRTPIIMLTARAELIDKVIGLESGANDYLTKPFEPRELVARIRVQLRDLGEAQSRLDLGDLEISEIERVVRFKGDPVEMTKMEFDLLLLLAKSPNKVFSRDEILNKVWGYENFPTTRTVDTHILQLRQKLDESLIETVRGIGYRFKKIQESP